MFELLKKIQYVYFNIQICFVWWRNKLLKILNFLFFSVKQADENNDGKITFDEFCNVVSIVVLIERNARKTTKNHEKHKKSAEKSCYNDTQLVDFLTARPGLRDFPTFLKWAKKKGSDDDPTRVPVYNWILQRGERAQTKFDFLLGMVDDSDAESSGQEMCESAYAYRDSVIL